jgi:hypothetical protein
MSRLKVFSKRLFISKYKVNPSAESFVFLQTSAPSLSSHRPRTNGILRAQYSHLSNALDRNVIVGVC